MNIKTAQTTLIEVLNAEISNPTWTGCDWETGLDDVRREAYETQVTRYAESALKYAQEARNHLIQDRFYSCVEDLKQAEDLENTFGESPTWGDFVVAAEYLEETRDDAEREEALANLEPILQRLTSRYNVQ